MLVIEGLDPQVLMQEKQSAWEKMDIKDHVRMYMEQGMGKKEAMKAAAADRGIGKRDVYQMLLEQKD